MYRRPALGKKGCLIVCLLRELQSSSSRKNPMDLHDGVTCIVEASWPFTAADKARDASPSAMRTEALKDTMANEAEVNERQGPSQGELGTKVVDVCWE